MDELFLLIENDSLRARIDAVNKILVAKKSIRKALILDKSVFFCLSDCSFVFLLYFALFGVFLTYDLTKRMLMYSVSV